MVRAADGFAARSKEKAAHTAALAEEQTVRSEAQAAHTAAHAGIVQLRALLSEHNIEHEYKLALDSTLWSQ